MGAWTSVKDYGDKALPIITIDALKFLIREVDKGRINSVLEFGGGGSTIWFSKQNLKKFISVENNLEWQKKLKTFIKNNNCELIHKNTPYYGVADGFDDESFDLVFVDGRDRVSCVNKSIRLVKPGGILMLDNSERKIYKEIYNKLSSWEMVKTTQTKPNLTTDLGKYSGHKKNHNYNSPDGYWATTWWVKPKK